MTRGWAKGSSEGLDVFYPIVPDIRWLERLVPLGLRTVQLRIKNAAPDEVRRQVASALEATRRAGCQLIVNDYWREAIEAGADYIHLGQEDLAAADLPAIKATGMRLGISTHSEEELEIALAADPDYVALGPIYETKLKAMTWAPQGLARIGAWKKRLGARPLVAIGGITPERAGCVIAAGADSVAVITDFLTAPHPEARVRLWLDWAAR
ncbi:MAG TPA: thiamine phosphate synthase [Hyphomicrobiaceae bacterium]|nr:thiamine phosphate synthase [Hyphomicrobiaceae bacterium]